MKYNGPFKVIQKLSPVSYWLWMPASYGIHPIINIAHLEKYQPSPAEFSNKIITEWRKRSKNGWRIIQYLTQFKGYSADSDESTKECTRNSGTMEEYPQMFHTSCSIVTLTHTGLPLFWSTVKEFMTESFSKQSGVLQKYSLNTSIKTLTF
jgi:hypothetical protein